MTPKEIRNHFLDNAPWVNPYYTCDQIIVGDPNRTLTKVGVGWYPSLNVLKQAHEAGCELFVTHEPCFWNWGDPPSSQWSWREPARSKLEFLKQSGLVVLREHDSWDNWPHIGIRDSWAKHLGLTHFIDEDRSRWHGVYQIEERTLSDFATYILEKTRALGQDSVQVLGDPAMNISRPSLGVGCGGPDIDMIDKGSDCLIVCFDGATYWAARERFYEAGAAVITVEHSTSEMPGIRNLANYIQDTWSALEVVYFDNHPKPWTVI